MDQRNTSKSLIVECHSYDQYKKQIPKMGENQPQFATANIVLIDDM